MRSLYGECAGLLAAGEVVVVATIAGGSGSAPRTAGTKMLVRRDGSLAGTIGGGSVEARVLETAREVFRTGRPVLQHFSLAGSGVDSTDMICGGDLEVLVEPWFPENGLEICRLAAECVERQEQSWLITRLPGPAGESGSLPKGLVTAGGRQAGAVFPEAGEILRHGGGSVPAVVTVGGDRFLLEAISSPGTVYIFGAGHVSQKLAEVTAIVNFRTVVLDDRVEFVSADRFPRADRLILLDDFAHCLAGLEISPESYLVIVTRGHRHDMTVLERALTTDAAYIGMIGSRRKIETIYRALREKGVGDEQLARVHAPIGLDIGAETPEEIAVSIAAELIAARAGANSKAGA